MIVDLVATKCAILLRQSTITRIESFPFDVTGNDVMKSKETFSHLREGIMRGCNKPPVRKLLAFDVLHATQDSTYLLQ